MKTAFRLFIIAGLAFHLFSMESHAAKLEVLIHAEEYHYGKAAFDLAEALNSLPDSSISSSFVNDSGCLNSDFLSSFDVVVLFNHNNIPQKTEENIRDFVSAGGGLLALHHVLNKANDNPVLVELIGAYYDVADGMIEHRDFNIAKIPGAVHPILEGIPSRFKIFNDQDFRMVFVPQADITRLLTCDIKDNGTQEDCGWIRKFGSGNVVFLSPGDPVQSSPFISNEPLFNLILNSINWLGND